MLLVCLEFWHFFFFFFFCKFETSWFEHNNYSLVWEYQHVWEYDSTTTFISFYQPSSRGAWPGVHGGYNLTRFGGPEAGLFLMGGGHSSLFQLGMFGSNFRSIGLANWDTCLWNWKFPKCGACELRISRFGGLRAKI